MPNQHCVRVAEGGRVLQTVPADRGCFACMLGGDDGRTLYVVANRYDAGQVTDLAGNPLPSSTFDFLVLAADANHDAVVDASDLLALAAHWQQSSGGVFSGGDFNYDGVVNEVDLSILSLNWQRTPDGTTQSSAPMPSILGVTPASPKPARPILRPATRLEMRLADSVLESSVL